MTDGRCIQVDRRSAILKVVPLSALIGLLGCESEPKPSATATLFDNEKVHEATQAVESATSNVEASVEDFDSENWREVVPKVKDAVVELRSAVDDSRSALGYQ